MGEEDILYLRAAVETLATRRGAQYRAFHVCHEIDRKVRGSIEMGWWFRLIWCVHQIDYSETSVQHTRLNKSKV